MCVCLCVSLPLFSGCTPPPHPFLSALPPLPCIPVFPADPERSFHDSAERPCGGLYIWGCHVRFSGAAKLGDAFKSQQLPLPRAKAYRFCGLAGLPAERVGNFTQLPQGLHITCECTSPPPPETHLNHNLCSANKALTFHISHAHPESDFQFDLINSIE